MTKSGITESPSLHDKHWLGQGELVSVKCGINYSQVWKMDLTFSGSHTRHKKHLKLWLYQTALQGSSLPILCLIFFFFFIFNVFGGTASLTMLLWLAWHGTQYVDQRFSCLYLPRAGIKSMHQDAGLFFLAFDIILVTDEPSFPLFQHLLSLLCILLNLHLSTSKTARFNTGWMGYLAYLTLRADLFLYLKPGIANHYSSSPLQM